MSIDEALREAAAKGLTHLSLWPVPSADGKTTYWNARATPSTGHQYVSAARVDPAEAVNDVLVNLPKAKKRVTAAVTEPSDLSGLPPGKDGLDLLDPEQWK
jgi:hypothetical protein